MGTILMPNHTLAERLKKSMGKDARILADPSKFLGTSNAADIIERRTRPFRSAVEKEIKRILGFITGRKR